jgi:hypothetical protein
MNLQNTNYVNKAAAFSPAIMDGWVNDSAASGKIQAWYTAAQAGCSSGTGTCAITPSTALATGSCQWWIQTWDASGFGPWSNGLAFTVTVSDDDIVGLWKFSDGSSVRVDRQVGVGYEYVGRMVTLTEKQKALGFKAGEEVGGLKRTSPDNSQAKWLGAIPSVAIGRQTGRFG